MLDFIEIPLGFNLLWKRLPLISRRLRTQRFKGLNISRESRWTFGISGSCQCCKGRFKDKILNVHHIESRKTGGNAPNNLITLCETCHKGYHNGTVILPKNIKHGMQFKDAAFMGIMRWTFYNTLKE